MMLCLADCGRSNGPISKWRVSSSVELTGFVRQLRRDSDRSVNSQSPIAPLNPCEDRLTCGARAWFGVVPSPAGVERVWMRSVAASPAPRAPGGPGPRPERDNRVFRIIDHVCSALSSVRRQFEDSTVPRRQTWMIPIHDHVPSRHMCAQPTKNRNSTAPAELRGTTRRGDRRL